MQENQVLIAKNDADVSGKMEKFHAKEEVIKVDEEEVTLVSSFFLQCKQACRDKDASTYRLFILVFKQN